MRKIKNDCNLFPHIVGLVLVSIILLPCIQSSNLKPITIETPVGWSDDIRVTDYYETDRHYRISISNDNVHIIWERWLDSPSGYEIFYTKSDTQGKTWALPFQLSENDYSVLNPDIFTSDASVHVVWNERIAPSNSFEIIYRNSIDSGTTWNPEQMISTDDSNNSQGPRVAVSENSLNVHVVWVDSRFGTTQTEVYYKRSTDGGITWDDGLGNPDIDRRITHDLSGASAAGIGVNASTIHVLFSDDRDGSPDVYYIRSVDNGATWDDGLGNVDEERKLTSNSTWHMASRMAIYGPTIHVVWADQVWPGPFYYLYYRNSTDNGATWNPIQLLVNSGTAINPSIDVAGVEVHVTWDDWRTGSVKEIYYINSSDGGISWNSETRLTAEDGNASAGPEIAILENHRHIIWDDQRDGNDEIYYKRYPDFPDISPPSHTNETPLPDSYRDAPGTNISVHVTDPSGVNESTIQLWVNGSLVTHTSTPITDGFNVSYESPGFEPGVVECRIVADDNCSNTLDFTWNFTVLAIYEIPLQEGWNLISVPHVQIDTAIDEVLRDIDGKWDYVQYYDAASGEWKSNATFKPQQLNDLFYLNRSMAFWINITEPDLNLTVRGHRSAYTEIPLYAGWNFVGYPTQTTETVANSLWGTGADRVEVFNATAPYRIKEVGPTYLMKPGEGYWVHVPANSVWIIDW